MESEFLSHDALLAGSFGATLAIDLAQGVILAATDEAETMLEAGALHGHSFSPYLADETGRAMGDFVVFVQEVQHRGSAWARHIPIRTAGGKVLTAELTGRMFAGAVGPVLLLHVLDLDALEQRANKDTANKLFSGGIMEWQRAQNFFSDLERENQLILDAAGEGIYGVNADGNTTFVNRAAQEILGWSSEDLLGHNIHAMIHHHHLNGESYPSHECPIFQSFRFEEVNRIEDEVFWRKDGKPVRVEYVSTPIYDGAQLAGAVVIFRDITERWESEHKLRKAMDQVAALRDQLEEENAYLQEAISLEREHHDIIGQSESIRRVIAQVQLVGPTDTSVLIQGESGVGKSLVATAIHSDSARKRRPLIVFKPGAVFLENIECDLFGQVRGAFTGALRDRPGKLELAHGGTLFLDEICDIPVEVQGRLLDALQTRSVVRLGDDRARSLDIRVIAATSRDIEREVSAGRLRRDFAMHLNVFPIYCPPLRDRPEDIPVLTAHLLRLVCKRLGRKVPIVTEGAMRKLQKYHWPGNVRELANVIERGAIVSQTEKLLVEINQHSASVLKARAALMTEAEVEQFRTLNTIACMKEAGGRVAGPDGAAALLGIKPTTLYSRLKKLGLKQEDWQ